MTWKRGLAAIGIVPDRRGGVDPGAGAGISSRCSSRRCCKARPPGSSRRRSAPSVSAWSAGARCRRAPAAIYRYAAAGHALTAAMMGAAGAYLAKGAIFIAAAALCVPALIALSAHPRRGDRLRAGAQCRAAGKQARQASPACLRSTQEPRARPVHRGARAVSARRRLDAAADRGKSCRLAFTTVAAMWMSGLDHRAADRGRGAGAVGRLPFGEAAAAGRCC